MASPDSALFGVIVPADARQDSAAASEAMDAEVGLRCPTTVAVVQARVATRDSRAFSTGLPPSRRTDVIRATSGALIRSSDPRARPDPQFRPRSFGRLGPLSRARS